MRHADGRLRLGRIAAALAGGVVLLLAIAQIVLPLIAAAQIRSKVARYGRVRDVSVSAWPAVELLWQHAGSVHVTADSLAMKPQQAAKLLWEARSVHDLDIDARSVSLGGLRVSGATLRKRGATLEATASASDEAVAAALPAGFSVSLLRSGGGRVEVETSGALFGVSATVTAVASAQDGRLVVRPRGFLLEALQLTLFEDAHVHVTGVGASALTDSSGYALSMAALLG